MQEVYMRSLMRNKPLRAMLAISVTFSVMVGRSAALAAENPGPLKSSVDDFDKQISDLDEQERQLMRTPSDFCDPAAVEARQHVLWHILYERFQARRQLGGKPTTKQYAQAAEDAVADEGYLVVDTPMTEDYEAAVKRGDKTAASAL